MGHAARSVGFAVILGAAGCSGQSATSTVSSSSDAGSNDSAVDLFDGPRSNDSSFGAGDGSCGDVLLLSTRPTAPAGLLSALVGSSAAFCKVDYFNVNAGPTPPAAALSAYGAVLVYNENAAPYTDPNGLGDSLATYFDGGGRVVLALFADAGFAIGGAFAANYLLMKPVKATQVTDTFSSANPADDLAPTSPVLADVTSIFGAGWRGPQTLQNGSVAVSNWTSGSPLAVIGTVKDANGRTRNRVDLNIQPTDIATGAWAGNGLQLLRNALLYE